MAHSACCAAASASSAAYPSIAPWFTASPAASQPIGPAAVVAATIELRFSRQPSRLGAGTSAAFLFVIRGPGDIVHMVGKHKDQKLTFSLDLHFLLTFALKYKVAFSIEYEELH